MKLSTRSCAAGLSLQKCLPGQYSAPLFTSRSRLQRISHVGRRGPGATDIRRPPRRAAERADPLRFRKPASRSVAASSVTSEPGGSAQAGTICSGLSLHSGVCGMDGSIAETCRKQPPSWVSLFHTLLLSFSAVVMRKQQICSLLRDYGPRACVLLLKEAPAELK